VLKCRRLRLELRLHKHEAQLVAPTSSPADHKDSPDGVGEGHSSLLRSVGPQGFIVLQELKKQRGKSNIERPLIEGGWSSLEILQPLRVVEQLQELKKQRVKEQYRETTYQRGMEQP